MTPADPYLFTKYFCSFSCNFGFCSHAGNLLEPRSITSILRDSVQTSPSVMPGGNCSQTWLSTIELSVFGMRYYAMKIAEKVFMKLHNFVEVSIN